MMFRKWKALPIVTTNNVRVGAGSYLHLLRFIVSKEIQFASFCVTLENHIILATLRFHLAPELNKSPRLHTAVRQAASALRRLCCAQCRSSSWWGGQTDRNY